MDNKKLQSTLILMGLDTNVQALADELEEDRTNVSKVINFQRTAPRLREKVSDAIAKKAKEFYASEPAESPG